MHIEELIFASLVKRIMRRYIPKHIAESLLSNEERTDKIRHWNGANHLYYHRHGVYKRGWKRKRDQDYYIRHSDIADWERLLRYRKERNGLFVRVYSPNSPYFHKPDRRDWANPCSGMPGKVQRLQRMQVPEFARAVNEILNAIYGGKYSLTPSRA